jgi:CubicO group peptidase (beta-lactamase class C family)
VSSRRLFFPFLLIGSVLALVFRAFSRCTPAEPISSQGRHDALDQYVEEKRRHLKIPGVSLAIVEGDKIPYRLSHEIVHCPGGNAARRSRKD